MLKNDERWMKNGENISQNGLQSGGESREISDVPVAMARPKLRVLCLHGRGQTALTFEQKLLDTV